MFREESHIDFCVTIVNVTLGGGGGGGDRVHMEMHLENIGGIFRVLF